MLFVNNLGLGLQSVQIHSHDIVVVGSVSMLEGDV